MQSANIEPMCSPQLKCLLKLSVLTWWYDICQVRYSWMDDLQKKLSPTLASQFCKQSMLSDLQASAISFRTSSKIGRSRAHFKFNLRSKCSSGDISVNSIWFGVRNTVSRILVTNITGLFPYFDGGRISTWIANIFGKHLLENRLSGTTILIFLAL